MPILKRNHRANGTEVFLEYVLQDFLELKASLNKEKARSIQDFLFTQELDSEEFSSVEGFHVGRQLVLIEPTNPYSFKHLVSLNPTNGSIQVRPLNP